MMENQNEKQEWNARWEQQRAEWELEMVKHLLEAHAYAALIELAESQITPEPPA